MLCCLPLVMFGIAVDSKHKLEQGMGWMPVCGRGLLKGNLSSVQRHTFLWNVAQRTEAFFHPLVQAYAYKNHLPSPLVLWPLKGP